MPPGHNIPRTGYLRVGQNATRFFQIYFKDKYNVTYRRTYFSDQRRKVQ